MAQTNIPFGSEVAMKRYSAGLFALQLQPRSQMGQLAGPMSTDADASRVLRDQSSNKYPVVRSKDLGRNKGDEVLFDLVNRSFTKPTMGSKFVEGRGAPITFSTNRCRIDQARFPLSLGDAMSMQRTVHDLRRLGRDLAESMLNTYTDDLYLVHMAGARGFADSDAWIVPLVSDPDFEEIMVNAVKAPSHSRHYMSSGDGIEPFKVTSGAVAMDTTDNFNKDIVDSLRALLDTMPNPLQSVIFEGDAAANDSPLRVLLVSPDHYKSFQTDSAFRTYQANAMARAQMAKMHPLFRGDVGLWNGILIVKMNKAIRFNKGDTIKYCADSSSTAESSCVVPDSFGTDYAIDRAILLGGQALMEAFGAHKDSGTSIFWSEKKLDHGDKEEISVASITGVSKIQFKIKKKDGLFEYIDHGVIAIDCAVKVTKQAI